MDALSEFQLSHRENVTSGHYNPLGHRESVENMYGVVTKPEVGARSEVWTQPIGEVWPPGLYGVSVHGERPEIVRFGHRSHM